MANDIRPYGSGDGLGFYWVKRYEQFGAGSLELVAIDEVGEVTSTGINKAMDEDGFTREAAVLDHLAAGIKQADASLERRRRSLPKPEPEKEPEDYATARRFLDAD